MFFESNMKSWHKRVSSVKESCCIWCIWWGRRQDEMPTCSSGVKTPYFSAHPLTHPWKSYREQFGVHAAGAEYELTNCCTSRASRKYRHKWRHKSIPINFLHDKMEEKCQVNLPKLSCNQPTHSLIFHLSGPIWTRPAQHQTKERLVQRAAGEHGETFSS